jgi:hypothetical protein
MLDYLLSNLVDYWNLFEINTWADILAVGTVPSIIFLIVTVLLAKIVHMHVNKNGRVMKAVLTKLNEDIRLHNEYLACKAENERLRQRQVERQVAIANQGVLPPGNVYSEKNLLADKIERYKTANEELRQRNRE